LINIIYNNSTNTVHS